MIPEGWTPTCHLRLRPVSGGWLLEQKWIDKNNFHGIETDSDWFPIPKIGTE